MEYILTSSCADRVGLVHDVTAFFKSNNYNIVELDQYVDRHENRFFMRIEFTVDEGVSGGVPAEGFQQQIASFMGNLNSDTSWELHSRKEKIRTALFVTKESHCLLDILSRSIDGELRVEIPLIISNHQELRYIAERFQIPFHYVEVTRDTKQVAERRQIELLNTHEIELIILAKYMQILSPSFIDSYPRKIINIHHSFLPAFPGSKPYHSAYQRGVKIIGATSHFVTEELDAGPIIEQDVIRIKHSDSIEDLKRKGKEVEKNVLSRAIWSFADRRVLTFGNKTIIF